MSHKVCVAACEPPPACFEFWWRRTGSYRSQGVRGGRREPSSTTYVRNGSDDAAIEVSSVYISVISLFCSVFVIVG